MARSVHSLNTISSSKPQQQQQVSLAKRLLFPQLPTNHLPPLLANKHAPPELNEELYDFIALALRAFVNPWWTKITRYDKEFLPEISQILTVVIRELECRVATLDLPPLLFHDIPSIITQHYQDYRNASSKCSTSYSGAGAVPLRQLFHQLQPHMAISPNGIIETEYMRQVVDVILKACLPKENYEPESERFIVREVILKVILHDVVPKISQPWFINKTILDLLQDGSSASPPLSESPSTQAKPVQWSFSFHNIIVFILSVIQSVSGLGLVLIHGYKQAMNTIKLVNQSQPRSRPPSPCLAYPQHNPHSAPNRPSPQLTQNHSTQPGQQNNPPHLHTPPLSESSSVSSIHLSSTPGSLRQPLPPKPPLPADEFARAPLLMLSEIFTTRERMASSVIMNTTFMTSSALTGFLDRLLPYMLNSTFSFRFVTNILRVAKRNLFPNGYPAPAPPDPTAEEQAIVLQKLVSWKPNNALTHVMPLFLGPEPPSTLAAALDPLSDVACNVHLIVFLLDRVLLALFPELGGGSDPDRN